MIAPSMECLLGVETEYGIAAFDRHGQAVERNRVLTQLMELARAQLRYLPDASGSGLFLENSSKFLVDTGGHPEISTPECADPADVVRYIRAGEQLLRSLATQLATRVGPDANVIVLRANVDLLAGTTWALHESFLYRTDPARLPRQLIPHLVSRLIYTGAGGLNRTPSGALTFTLSPRVQHLHHVLSPSSTSARGIFHTKDEPLAGNGFHRLHLLCGETVCSDLAAWLKMGTTALIVALIDAGISPGEEVQLRDPLDAMRRFASDPTCTATVESECGTPLTAIDIQRHYLAQVERHLAGPAGPPWAGDLCTRWREILDRLASAPDSLATTLDWAIKQALYKKSDRWGVAWSSLPLRNDVAMALCELDMRFGELSDRGVFDALDRAAVLHHRVEGVDRIEEAVREPPRSGRASVRGRVIKELASRPHQYECDWSAVHDRRRRRVLDLSDPFADSAEWRDLPAAPSRAPAATDSPSLRGRARYGVGAALYRRSRLRDALAGFADAASFFRTCDDPEQARVADFWRATTLHNLGRLQEAEAALTPLADATAGNAGILYKIWSRYALIAVEQPLALGEIEARLTAMEERIEQTALPAAASRLLLVRASLLRARGLYADAGRVAEEGLARARSDTNAFAITSYMRLVLSIHLALGQLDRVRARLTEWQRARVDQAATKEVIIAWGRSELARRAGQLRPAVRWAEQAAEGANAGEELVLQVFAGTALVRALSCSGERARADEALLSLHHLWFSEVRAYRYLIHLLEGDHRLNCARVAGALPLVDPEGGREWPRHRARRCRDAGLREITSAGRAYWLAMWEARNLDQLLQSTHRSDEVVRRYALLRQTRDDLNGTVRC